MHTRTYVYMYACNVESTEAETTNNAVKKAKKRKFNEACGN